MIRYYFQVLFFLSFVAFTTSCNEDVLVNSPNKLVVIIKADDLGDTTTRWNRFIKMIDDLNINAGIGVIAKNVHSNSIDELRRVSNLKQTNGFPVIEFWNHGYDHWHKGDKVGTEFFGTDYDYQLLHLQLAQHFFLDSLFFTCHTFGAPFNRTSETTYTVINQFTEINVWQCFKSLENHENSYWKDPKDRVIHSSDKHILLSVDFLSLKTLDIQEVENNYSKFIKNPYVLLQIHPANWDDAMFVDFEKLIRFYQETNRTIFMTPYQYFQYLQTKDLNKNLY